MLGTCAGTLGADGALEGVQATLQFVVGKWTHLTLSRAFEMWVWNSSEQKRKRQVLTKVQLRAP